MANALMAGWILISVTSGGAVHETSSFPSRALCEDALSIAKTGLTVTEKKAADDNTAREGRRLEEAWRSAHPPRPPRNELERQLVNRGCSGNLSGVAGGAGDGAPAITPGSKNECPAHTSVSFGCPDSAFGSSGFSEEGCIRVKDGLIYDEPGGNGSGGSAGLPGPVAPINHDGEIKYARCLPMAPR